MHRIVPPTVLARALAGLLFFAAPVWALPPGYTLQLVHSPLDFPTTIKFAPDGRLFYTELATGRIMVFQTGTSGGPTVWATVPILSGGEHGILGLAFHPQFPDSPFVYVFHTRPSPVYNRIARLKDQNGVGVNYTVLVDSLFANSLGRFGGRMAFGPDQTLYVTIGDCTLVSAAQDPTNTIGKILRLGLTGKPAPGSAFGAGNPVCDIGVRNPYGLCFDPVTGYGYFTDNGPACDDELNRLIPGQNYGWGNSDFCGGQPPGTYSAMLNITPTVGVTGCTMYRPSTSPYPSFYNGNLFFGTYVDASIRRVVFHSTPSGSVMDSMETWTALEIPPDQEVHVLDVTTGPDGRIWFSTFDSIWRVMEKPNTPTGVGDPPVRTAMTVAPNPSSGAVTFALPGTEGFDRVEILDVTGRRVRAWSAPIDAMLVWDGRAGDGRPVEPGVYFVRAIRGGRSTYRRMVRIAR